MLRFMRDKATSWLIKIILGAIVIVFIFWGVGSFRSQRFSRVAVVNGDVITVDDYREAYNNLIEQIRRRFGNSLDENMLKALGVKEQALNSLVDNRILVQEAQKLKFRVTDAELAAAIRDFGPFQRAGTFDSQLYKNVLNQLRMTPEQFEVAQREAMLVEKLRTLITQSVKVSEQEALEWYNWLNQTVNLEFVVFEPGRYKDLKPAEEEIQEYFEKNKSKYKTEPMVKARYVMFRPDAYLSKVTVTDNEIRQHFEANSQEFKKPKTVEARHILLRLDPNADAETVSERRKKAVEIQKMAQSGKDFAKLASQYSEGPTKDRGGYLGEFPREAMVKPFADKAFSMAAGEISDPVRTQFGWHIIKVEKVNPESNLSFDESKEKIRSKLTFDRAKALAYDDAETISDISFDGEDLVHAASERGLKVTTTDFFDAGGPESGMGSPAEFAAAAFELPILEVSDIKEFEGVYFILQPLEKKEPEIPELTPVREKVAKDLVKEMQDRKAHEDAKALLEAIRAGGAMAAEAEKFKLEPRFSGFVKRNDSIPGIGVESKINEAAFKMSAEKRLPEDVVKIRQGYCVMVFKEGKNPDSAGFGAEEKTIRQSLLTQKQAKTFQTFLAQAKAVSEITIEKTFFE